MTSIMSSLISVVGVFGIGMIIGLVVLVTTDEALTVVARTAARDVSGSFWAGVFMQLLAIPALTILIIACTITIIGILLIPLVALAWALTLAGAVTMGLLAVAIVIGRALSGTSTSERATAVRGLTVGLIALSLVWCGAALAARVPVAGVLVRLVAVAFTWAVATVGLGAVVKSRIGVSRFSAEFGRFRGSMWSGRWGSANTTSTNEIEATIGWQTPTPVQGVVAARRPLEAAPTSAAAKEPGRQGDQIRDNS